MNEKELFRFDYAVADEVGLAFDRPATNIGELWWNDEKERVLRLWQMHTKKSFLSDYDRFCAICDMMPLLEGHPIKRHCEDFLQHCFLKQMPTKKEEYDALWREIADSLLMHRKTVTDLNGESLPILDRCGIVSAERLLSCDASELEAWNKTLRERLQNWENCRVLLRIPCAFRFVEPDPYHVGLALKKEKRTSEEAHLLFAQGARMLCLACVEKNMTLQLELEENAKDVAFLLSYLERTVGLPQTVWSTASSHTRDVMLDFGYQTHQKPIIPVINLQDHPSERELTDAIEAYAARYPIGLLGFVCGSDVRDHSSDRRYVTEILKRGYNRDQDDF